MKIKKSDRKSKENPRALKENDAGGGGDVGSSGAFSYDASGMYGYGYGYGYGGSGGISFGKGDLYKIFVEPFADVFKTIAGQTKEVSRRLVTLLEVALEGVLSTLIPFVSAEYGKIFDRESQDIERIRSEYKDVYARTNEAFGNNDIAVLAFMAYPAEFLASSISLKAPSFIRGMLGAITGGYSERVLKNVIESKIQQSNVSSFKRLTEDEEKKTNKKPSLSDVVGSKKFILHSIKNSPKAAEVSRASQEAYLKSLIDTQEKAKQMLAIKTIDDVERISGKSKEIDKIKLMPDKEKAVAEKEFVNAVRESMKKVFVAGLHDRVSKAISGGVKESNKFVQDHLTVIDNIMKL